MKLEYICFVCVLTFLGCSPEPSVLNEEPLTREATSPQRVSRDDYQRQPKTPESIVIGLDADMTSVSAQSGEAIRRGILLAIEEVNSSGGVIGRPLELVARDHRGNPARGIDNINELASLHRLVAIVGGIHTPVALEELPAIHENKVIYLGPWAAGTPLVANGYSPNFVFRVSVRDEYAGEFLVNKATQTGHRRIGLLLEQTGWGRSNQAAMTKALQSRGLKPTAVEWFNWGEPSLHAQIQTFVDADVETVLLVANPLEGALAIREMAALEENERMPIISHWGITGGDFTELARADLTKVDLVFLQTFSFLTPEPSEQVVHLVDSYCRRFKDANSARDIFAPAGTAHAYELVRMLATAIESAGTTEREAVRDALEKLQNYHGLIRNYDQPFAPKHHDALSIDDFQIACFGPNGTIKLVPVRQARDSDGKQNRNQ